MSNKRNPVGWFEIYVQNMEVAQSFYEQVFQLELEELATPDDSLLMLAFPQWQCSDEATGSPGALVKMGGIPSGAGGTIVYFNCEDCADEESRVEAAGGNVAKPKMSIGDYGYISLVIDTEGNMIGLHSMK